MKAAVGCLTSNARLDVTAVCIIMVAMKAILVVPTTFIVINITRRCR